MTRIGMKAGLTAVVAVVSLLVPGIATAAQHPKALLGSSVEVPVDLPAAVTAGNTSALADAVAQASSVSSEVVVLAPADDELSLAQAAANATFDGSIALLARSADATDVLAQLAAFAPTTVKLLGAPTSFSSEFITALETKYTVNTAWVAVDTYSRSAAANVPLARTRLVVTDSDSVDVQALATTLAIGTQSSLLILDGKEDLPKVVAVLEDTNNAQVTIVGAVATVLPYQSVSQAVINRTMWLDTSDVAVAEQLAIQAMVSAGRNAPRVVAATESGLGVRTLAGIAAKAADGVTGTQAAVTSYVEQLHSPLSDVSVVGMTASQQKATAISLAWPVTQAAPAFRVVNVVPNADRTSYVVTTTSVAGASRYAAYDRDGVELGASSTPTITVGGAPASLAIAATSTNGELGQVQMRINDYSASVTAAQVLVGSISDGRDHLVFLGGAGVPRLITRTQVDVFGLGTAVTATQVVGVTCSDSYTDVTADSTFQYDYRATTLSNDAEVCGLTATVDPNPSSLVSGVTFPPTEFPVFEGMAAARGTDPQQGTVETPKARRSFIDHVISAEASNAPGPDSATTEGFSAQAVGDDWPDMVWRYQGWIRDDLVPGTPPSGRLTRPFTFFHGDNRGADPLGSHRFRQDVRVKFGSAHNLVYSEHMGETVKYACRLPNGTDCEEVSRATASAAQLSMVDTFHSNLYGWFAFKVDATNPLQPGAPAISSEINVIYGPGKTVLIGKHDKMPSHEIWFYAEGWGEWENAYVTREVGLQCLAGWLPRCTEYVNVTL